MRDGYRKLSGDEQRECEVLKARKDQLRAEIEELTVRQAKVGASPNPQPPDVPASPDDDSSALGKRICMIRGSVYTLGSKIDDLERQLTHVTRPSFPPDQEQGDMLCTGREACSTRVAQLDEIGFNLRALIERVEALTARLEC